MSTGGDESLQVSLLLDAGPAAPVVAEAVGMFRSILDVLAKAREQTEQFANATTKVRDSLRDIKALSGGGGAVTDEFLRGQLNFMKETGFTQTEAHDFKEQFLGEAAAFKEKMKTPEEFEKVQTDIAKYSLSQGADPGTMAKLAGRVIALGGEGQTSESVLGQSAEIFRRINLGSGEASLALKAYTNAAASQVLPGGGGQVGNLESLAALAMGASRLGSEGQIDTKLMQFGRVMSGAAGSKWEEYLRSELKVPEGEKAQDAMQKVFAEMEKVANIGPLTGTKEEIAAKAKDIATGGTRQGRDLDAWLREHGVLAAELRQTTIGMYAQRQPIMAELEGRGPDPRATAETARADIRRHDANIEGLSRKADSTEAAVKTEIGMRFEEATLYKKIAKNELFAEGLLGPEQDAANAFNDYLTKGGGFSRETMLLDQRARQVAQRMTHMSMQQEEPGLLAKGVGWVSTIMPEMAAGVAGVFSPATGERMRSRIAGTRGTIAGNIRDRQGIAANDFVTDVQMNRDAIEVHDLQKVMVYGPSGQLSLSQYGDIFNGKGPEGDRMMAMLTEQARRLMQKPLLGPRPGDRVPR